MQNDLSGYAHSVAQCLSTLFIYNKVGPVAKFAHFLTQKMRFLGVKGIILSLEIESDNETIR